MLKRTLLIIALTPSVALADKEFTGSDGATYDCAADPVVNITTGGGTYTFTGACKQVNLNAGKVKITVADVEELNINGANNAVTVAEVGAININGAKNKVTWKKAKTGKKPAVASNGVGNAVAKGK